MAYVYGNGFGNYDGLFSKIGGAIKSVGRAVDPTYSKSLIGQAPVVGSKLTALSRQAVATGAAWQTLGLSVVAGERGLISRSTFGVKPTAQGFATGAAIGGAIMGGQSLASAGAAGLKSASPVAAPAVSVPVTESAETVGATNPAGRGRAIGPAAGAGVGFLAGGPVGALVGAAAGYFLTRPRS